MRWKGGRKSTNVEDRRGVQTSGGGRRRGGFGIRGGVFGVVLAVGALAMGVDPRTIMGLLVDTNSGGGSYSSTGSSQNTQRHVPSAAENEMAEFTKVVLADTEDTWHPIFRQYGKRYKEPKLVMFTGVVKSACGTAQSAMGPFYCPADQKVYIDLSFYDDLKRRHGAPGDFAQAYVIAHEVGHHIQTILGISGKVHKLKSKVSKVEGNKLSVMQELQADCFAGVWAHHADRARQILERGDIDEALNAASQIGDDTLQRKARGHVVPESFTHGTGEQRIRWFKQGLQNGTIEGCDTFNAKRL